MATPPGKVIRSLRQALDMSQAEFARAAGYAPSTISSWERGTTRPSRLAFKTILAFAEERGVRYRPTPANAAVTHAALPPPPTSGLPALRLGSHLPPPPPPTVVVHERGREESFGSRHWTNVAASGVVVDVAPTLAVEERAAAFDARVAAAEPARSELAFDAHVRFELGAGSEWVKRAVAFVAVLAALAVGAGTGLMLRGGRASARAIEPERVQAAVPDAPRALVRADELALAAVTTPPLEPSSHGAAVAAANTGEAPAPAPVAAHARLESIVALDGTRRATFRVGDRSITLVEGDALGGRTLSLIGNDEVALIADGVATRVRLGFETPLD